MEPPDLVLVSQRVILPDGVAPAAVSVRDGVVAAIGPGDSPPRGRKVVDAGESVIMPGLVDTHVHVNEPGRTEWEGFETATRAAAAGGVTTIVDMPLNSVPPTTTPAALVAKAEAAVGRCRVDYGFWGGVVPGNRDQLEPLLHAGVLGFKAFLVPSGVDEFPAVSGDDLWAAMPFLAARGVPLLVHAESPERIDLSLGSFLDRSGQACPVRRYAEYLASRPPIAEEEAIDAMIGRCEGSACWVHIVHVATGSALAAIDRARKAGLPLTTETCPHYLTFDGEAIGDGDTLYKCAPPIRESGHRDRLWEGLREGVLDMVVSDHSPCPPSMKCIEEGDFARAWGGIASLELGLPAVWTEADRRGVSLAEVVQWMCAAPARLAGLDDRKGAIAVNRDADFVVWDPDATFEVDSARLHDRHRRTPYEGRTLSGVVRKTYVRGMLVYDDGLFPGEPIGDWLRRGLG